MDLTGCPVCSSRVQWQNISFYEFALFCMNEECDYPIGYEWVTMVDERHKPDDDKLFAQYIDNCGISITVPSSGTSMWSELERLPRGDSEDSASDACSTKSGRYSVKRQAKKKPGQGQIDIQKQLDEIKNLNKEIYELDCKSQPPINSQNMLKNLMELQESSGKQLLKQEEIKKLRKNDPIIGSGELQINISSNENVPTSIDIKIVNDNESTKDTVDERSDESSQKNNKHNGVAHVSDNNKSDKKESDIFCKPTNVGNPNVPVIKCDISNIVLNFDKTIKTNNSEITDEDNILNHSKMCHSNIIIHSNIILKKVSGVEGNKTEENGHHDSLPSYTNVDKDKNLSKETPTTEVQENEVSLANKILTNNCESNLNYNFSKCKEIPKAIELDFNDNSSNCKDKPTNKSELDFKDTPPNCNDISINKSELDSKDNPSNGNDIPTNKSEIDIKNNSSNCIDIPTNKSELDSKFNSSNCNGLPNHESEVNSKDNLLISNEILNRDSELVSNNIPSNCKELLNNGSKLDSRDNCSNYNETNPNTIDSELKSNDKISGWNDIPIKENILDNEENSSKCNDIHPSESELDSKVNSLDCNELPNNESKLNSQTIVSNCSDIPTNVNELDSKDNSSNFNEIPTSETELVTQDNPLNCKEKPHNESGLDFKDNSLNLNEISTNKNELESKGNLSNCNQILTKDNELDSKYNSSNCNEKRPSDSELVSKDNSSDCDKTNTQDYISIKEETNTAVNVRDEQINESQEATANDDITNDLIKVDLSNISLVVNDFLSKELQTVQNTDKSTVENCSNIESTELHDKCNLNEVAETEITMATNDDTRETEIVVIVLEEEENGQSDVITKVTDKELVKNEIVNVVNNKKNKKKKRAEQVTPLRRSSRLKNVSQDN